MDETKQHVVASSSAPTIPNYREPRLVEVPSDRPGIVIFLHGVNDPGATYPNVEQGICEGLNWRLNRRDLVPGVYGADWQEAKDSEAKAKANNVRLTHDVAAIINDPDTNLYRRTEIERQTNSVFIPFYWGYRASDKEIAKDKDGNPIRLRGQYQDIRDNRLDAHFAKEGGFFDNATNNIPDMYGAGFKRPLKATMAQPLTPDYSYVGDSPDRLYFVLAAQRLAMLIREIRAASTGQGTANETITVIGHSQGTIIGLLAQAMLAAEGGDARPLDTLIMVDTPYAVWENGDEEQTSQAKLKTLGNIVKAVTAARHAQPSLTQLRCTPGNAEHHGRTGPKWTPQQGVRPLGRDGAEVAFTERDNRGKVYLYFCTDDQVVALDSMRGLGTFGLPDTVSAPALGTTWEFLGMPMDRPGPFNGQVTLPGMSAFKAAPGQYAFHQRMWTKEKRDGKPVLVGLPPQVMPARIFGESPRPGTGLTDLFLRHSYYTMVRGQMVPTDGSLDRWINGERIDPPWVPRLHGGETRDKHGRPTGELPVDAVGVDVALGNKHARFRRIPMPGVHDEWTGGPANADVVKADFNRDKDIGDQTQTVWVTPHIVRGGIITGYTVEREETPNEAQARLAGHDTEANTYHSGILNDRSNLSAVAAMDVAIGQAKTLDDPDWRRLLMAIADWRTDWRPEYNTDSELLTLLGRLTPAGQKLVIATSSYYYTGIFPSADLVPRTWPDLVKSQTKDQRAAGTHDPGVIV